MFLMAGRRLLSKDCKQPEHQAAPRITRNYERHDRRNGISGSRRSGGSPRDINLDRLRLVLIQRTAAAREERQGGSLCLSSFSAESDISSHNLASVYESAKESGASCDAPARREDCLSDRLAEGVGFEPTLRFPVNTLSKRAPSATRPPLLIAS